MSKETPYRGILIYHATGVGKTCSAITIAENYRKDTLNLDRKILLVVNPNIRNEFIKTIFNFEKESTKTSDKQVVQCTGRTYSLSPELLKSMSAKKTKSKVMEMIKDTYQIIGRDGLRNKVLRETGWNGEEKSLTDKQRDKLKNMFSNRVMIVDEAHNRVGTAEQDKSIPNILNAIVGNAENMKVILMTATPMVNSPKDIIFPINLLRLNDNRPQVLARSVFKNDGTFQKDGEALLKEMCRGYISYVRGGDPPRFPFSLIPPEAKVPSARYQFNGELIPQKKRIRYTKVILCNMESFQKREYKNILKQERKKKIGGLLPGTSQAGNIVFPSAESANEGLYGASAYSTDTQTIRNSKAPILEENTPRGKIYRYNNSASNPNVEGFFLRKKIQKYSAKFAAIFDNIVGSTGISFVYSEYIGSGVLAFALMLEENGFQPAIITGQEPTERFRSKTKKPPIGYLCGKTKKESKRKEEWAPAKYVLLTGSNETTKEAMAKIAAAINREDNMYGKTVKVILGSRVAGEGIDFKRIRQVHIIEPWYNRAKLMQVEGRAIRNGSHQDLPPEQRNVDIYRYCLRSDKDAIETIDEYDYRISEDKDIKISAVDYILKQIAVDCNFQRHNTIRLLKRTVTLEDSRGRKIRYQTGDRPFTKQCDYRAKCGYKCEWTAPRSVILNKSTYVKSFEEMDIQKVMKVLRELYQRQNVYSISQILHDIRNNEGDIEAKYVYVALERLMKKDHTYSLKDKFQREGYLLERDYFYIYHPLSLENKNAPLTYKKTPLKSHQKEVFIFQDNVNVTTSKKQSLSGQAVLQKVCRDVATKTKILKKSIPGVNKYRFILTEMIFFRLSNKDAFSLLKHICTPNISFTEEKKCVDAALQYYDSRKHILINDKKRAVMISDMCAQWSPKKTKKAKSKEKSTLRWRTCEGDIRAVMQTEIQKDQKKRLFAKLESAMPKENRLIPINRYLETLRESGMRAPYVATLEEKKKNSQKYLKILDFSQRNSTKVSKRNQIRGRVCETLDVVFLKNMLLFLEKEVKKEGIVLQNLDKNSRDSMCFYIEFLLRLLQHVTKKIWFYESYFDI